MDVFTISQLAQFTGVKAPTIRMWEQRYKALQPFRSEGNTRYYDSFQLRRLLNIVSLQENGRRISELGSMQDKELFELLKRQSLSLSPEADLPNKNFYISQLLAAGMTYDTPYFEKILAHCLLRFGMKATYTDIIYPMLLRIGVLWSTDELPPAQEHFISNLLRQKLYTAMDSLPPPEAGASSWLLFLPENEFHEIGLLVSDYLLRLKGQNTLYLGGNVPLASLASAAEAWPSENLLFFLVHREAPENIELYLQELQEHFPHKRLVLSCDPALLKEVNLPSAIRLLHSLPDLEGLLEEKVTMTFQ